MPSKPLKPCNKLGCNQLTREKYCSTHKQLEQVDQKIRNQYYDRFIRDKKSQAFYNSDSWKKLRTSALNRDRWLCQHCLKNKRMTPADIVDHIIPIKVNWDLRLSLENTQSLCLPCHNRKTAEDKRIYGL